MRSVSHRTTYQSVGPALLALSQTPFILKGLTVNVGILGTGNLAETLGRAWSGKGHRLSITGRSPRRAAETADRIGGSAVAVDPADFAAQVGVVVVAVAWDGLRGALTLIGSAEG